MKLAKNLILPIVAILGIETWYILKKKPETKKKILNNDVEEGVKVIVDELYDFNKELIIQGKKAVTNPESYQDIKDVLQNKQKELSKFVNEFTNNLQAAHKLNKEDMKKIKQDFSDIQKRTQNIMQNIQKATT